MSENYVKKYDVGQIKLDLPYANFIHELPLLSFGDVLHTVNLNLVFNYERYNAENASDNPFFIAPGYKLNLQKRILIDVNNQPAEFQEENGKTVGLTSFGDVFTFNDDSQRILRRTVISSSNPNSGSSTLPARPNPNGSITPVDPITLYEYTVEYPDYSIEKYNTNGRIVDVYDKYGEQYLSYAYESFTNKLSYVKYRNEKTINLYYDNLNRLSSIVYGSGNPIFPITFTYSNNGIIVKHYSEVDFHFEISNNTFDVYSSDRDTDYSNNYSHKLECTKNNDSIKVDKTIGEETVDTVTYNFLNFIEKTNKINLLDVTNKHGVTTRIQFENDKPAYSYEVTAEINNEVCNNDIKYMGKVAIYNNNNIVGYQSYLDGYKMTDVSNDGGPHHLVMTENASGYFILSGWVNVGSEDDIIQINIKGSGDTVDASCSIPIIKKETWQYFAVSFKANAFQFINVSASPSTPTVYLRDLKITFQEGVVLEQKYSKNIMLTREVLIQENSNGDDIRYFLLNDNDNSYHFYKGDILIEKKITAKDILKYKFNQKHATHTDEIYCNSCRYITTSTDALYLKYVENGNTYTIPVTSLAVGTMSYKDGKKYITKTNFSTGGSSSKLLTKSSMNDVYYKEDVYDEYFNLISSTVDGITTDYERNNKGLIVSQTISTDDNSDVISISAEYDSNCTKILSTFDEFGAKTEYTTDDIWGVITEIKLPNQTVLKNNYDKGKSVLIEKEFGDRSNSLDYSGGNLDVLATDNLKYKMSYTDGYMTGMSKYNPSTDTFNRIESHTYNDNSSGETTVFSKYPSSTSPLHTEYATFDKYGRLKEINGVLINTYDICPSFNDYTGEMSLNDNNSSALLGITTDLLRSETSRYKYNNNGELIEKTVTNKNDFSDKISIEAFVYDDVGRLIENGYMSKNSETKVLGSLIHYLKDANDPLADNKIDEISYCEEKIEGALLTVREYKTTNEYNDPFHRLSKKTHTLDSGSFTKQFTYDKTRIESIVDSAGGTISYTYDSMGRIASMTIGEDTISYTYDSYGQLIREDNKALDKRLEYEYNGIGNIMSVTTYNLPDGTEPIGNGTVNTLQYNDTSHPDRLTKCGYKNIGYNAIGYPVTYGSMHFDWENGKLAKYYEEEDPYGIMSSESTEFTYNAFGDRIRKEYSYYPGEDYSGDFTIGKEVNYDYDHSGRLIREISTEYFTESASETIELVFLYDESGMIGFTHSRNGSTPQAYYYQRNLQGDVVGIYDTSGTKVASYAYDAYGNCTATGSMAQINPIRYRGYYWDSETNWYYLNARYYSPEWRRFISPDDTAYLDPESVNGLNLYCYCNNDPINFVDPSGHFGIWALIGITVGAMLIGGGIQLASNAISGESGTDLWQGVFGASIGAGVNALLLCLGLGWGKAAYFIAAGAGTLVQTGFNTIENKHRGNSIDGVAVFKDLGNNFLSNTIGNFIGAKLIPTNPGWFQPQKFISVFTKSYGQKLLSQAAIGSIYTAIANYLKEDMNWLKYTLVPVGPIMPTAINYYN